MNVVIPDAYPAGKEVPGGCQKIANCLFDGITGPPW